MPGEQGERGERGECGYVGGQGDTGQSGVAGGQGIPGPMGRTGRTGRRGPQGAADDTGESGERGAPGLTSSQEERRLTNVRFSKSDRHILFMFAIAMIAVVLIGWGNDVKSCQRVNRLRQVDRVVYASQARNAWLRAQIDTGALRASDLERYRVSRQSAMDLRALNCIQPYPETR